MAVSKPSIPKGTRDFSTFEMSRRTYIFDTIRSVFQLYGFLPIETPAMENISTLMGKYGEEGDKLLFRILNSGDFLSSVDKDRLSQGDSRGISPFIVEKGLRYDLTVPFARFVVQHRNELQFPFRRYQIQPVWRADRPQKGRYREFYQCDADVIGSTSLNNEVELLQLIDEVFARLGIKVKIKINNRKILSGIAEIIGEPSRLIDITVAIDKMEKIGRESVNAELSEKGLSGKAIELLQPFLEIEGTVENRLAELRSKLSESEIGKKGIEELEYVINASSKVGLRSGLDLDVSLARGLNYYTGIIIEVKAEDFAIGSISGGGRYDNLTGIFGLPDVSGVGVSFGADRIYDVMMGLNLFPDVLGATSRVMFVNFGKEEALASMRQMKALRNAGISCELYPDCSKIKKQLSYASERNISYVAMIGADEMARGEVAVKNMVTGEQKVIASELIVNYFNSDC